MRHEHRAIFISGRNLVRNTIVFQFSISLEIRSPYLILDERKRKIADFSKKGKKKRKKGESVTARHILWREI